MSSLHFAYLSQPHSNEQSNNTNKTKRSLFYRLQQWFGLIKGCNDNCVPQGQLLFNDASPHSEKEKIEMMCISDIPFVIPRRIEDVRKDFRPSFERAKLVILRMDEYLLSSEDKSKARRRRHQDTSLGLRALAEAAHAIQRLSFREVLTTDETLAIVGQNFIEEEEDSVMDKFFRQTEKIDSMTEFLVEQDFVEFDRALSKHRMDMLFKPTHKPSEMMYLKFCLMLEIQRDENENCLRILLHDIIFKFHLTDFRLRCEIHVRKPIERKLILEKVIHDSHLKSNYSAELVLISGDWIVQQEAELYVVMKIESLSINKYLSSKFWDMAHLHVKNIPHGASRMFLRELTPVTRPHRIHLHDVDVGQVEIEAVYWPVRHELLIHILKISHSHAERLLRSPEIYVEVIFQSPFDIYEIKRTKSFDRSSNSKVDEEFLFSIPEKVALNDVTIDLIFLEKTPLHHHHSLVLGVLTLSKHTDWFPVRKFWTDVEENPNVKIKDRFLFEGNIYD